MIQAWNARKFQPVTSEAATLLKLAVPLCIAQIASISILTADIWMMGQLSAFDLASGSLAIRLYQPFYFFSLGLLSLTGPLVAQALGAGDQQARTAHLPSGAYSGCAIRAGMDNACDEWRGYHDLFWTR